MKRVLSLVLLLMLVLGSACADTESTVLEYEVLDAEAAYEDLAWVAVDSYEGETIYWTKQPFVIKEYVDGESGLTNWDIDWADEDGDWIYMYASGWFPESGILGEADYDLDGDGAEEKIVLSSDCDDDLVINGIVVRVYEKDFDGLRYADGAYLNDQVSLYGSAFKAFLTQINGEPRFVFFDEMICEGPWTYLWTISYQNEQLAVDKGMNYTSYSSPVLLNGNVPIDALYLLSDNGWGGSFFTKEFVDEWSNGSYSEQEQLEIFAQKMGLTWKNSDGISGAEVFSQTDEVVLFNVNNRARDAEGNPILRIQRAVPGKIIVSTASVNLRAEPDLDGEIIAAVEAGENLPYLGEESTDDRGVVWYKAMHENQPCWVSSKYAALN